MVFFYSRMQEEAAAIDNPVYTGIESTTGQTTGNRNQEKVLINPLYGDTAFSGPSNTINSMLQYPAENDEQQHMYEPVDQSSMEEEEGVYETPQGDRDAVQVVSKQEAIADGSGSGDDSDYSRLNLSDVSYATLEPHIPGRKGKGEPTQEEGEYSQLQHIWEHMHCYYFLINHGPPMLCTWAVRQGWSHGHKCA